MEDPPPSSPSPSSSSTPQNDEIRKFHLYNDYLGRRETRKATRSLCELMDHDSFGCDCFQVSTEEEKAPEIPKATIVQPDRNFDGNHEMSVAGWFIIPPPPPPSTCSSSFFSSESLLLHHKKRRLQYTPETTVTSSTRKPYSYKDRKHKNAQERREIKKKLFMDLGIIRTNCGIDNEEKDREEAMKRKVTETIVTTYCELCEQNFSSSKMLLLHRAKVHKTPFIECHLCLKLFSQTIQFNRHMKTHYGPNAMRFVQCEHCDRQFKDKEALKTHWKVSHPTTSAFINVHFS